MEWGQIEKQVAKGDFNLNPTEDGHHSIQQLLYTGFAEYNNQQTVFQRDVSACAAAPQKSILGLMHRSEVYLN